MCTDYPPVIVLMTDFGLTDTFVGQMKGVIISLAPFAQIIDLTHAITPQNVVQGAFLLAKSICFFPERSIFISVVDPGVGTVRKAIAVETDSQTFLAPDNGLLTGIFLTQTVKRCVSITEEQYMLSLRSSTFHGRDVFSPIAAHIASGVPLTALGNDVDLSDCVKIIMPECHTGDQGLSWNGSIIYTDHFGNLVTSVDAALLDERKQWVASVRDCEHIPVVNTYGDARNQQALAYAGSSGMIEIAVRNGNASRTLGLLDGDGVTISAILV